MFTSKITIILFFFMAFALLALTHPVEDQPESQTFATTPEDVAALAIINDPTPKFFANITFTDEVTLQNITAQASYICDTTSGSPSVHWLREISGRLRGEFHNQQCKQRNELGSRCTQLIAMGDAAASICGSYTRWFACDYVGFAGFWITDHCAWNGLAGGRFFVEDKFDTKFTFHKPS
ncbi:hypothetical protein B9Z19DRAFT_1094340 [Tuber borchii]|uniref:Ig-like domain-containing protein n=1 Tax=Tuber borchii TaxID=42251 RepID=A0A2T6ZEF8_TUBBO|nr:hypothetical protein B9Z19DRAFT_1094340 [Tuber borchii]